MTWMPLLSDMRPMHVTYPKHDVDTLLRQPAPIRAKRMATPMLLHNIDWQQRALQPDARQGGVHASFARSGELPYSHGSSCVQLLNDLRRKLRKPLQHGSATWRRLLLKMVDEALPVMELEEARDTVRRINLLPGDTFDPMVASAMRGQGLLRLERPPALWT